MDWTFVGIAAVLGYLLGSVPVGYLIGRLRGLDIRRYGSGGTGGTNVARTLGLGYGIVTAVADIAKGLVAYTAAAWLWGEWHAAAAGALAVVGHCWPVWLRWRGGKGVATAAGALVVPEPVLVGIGFVVFVITVALSRYVSLGSLIGTGAVLTAVFCVAPLPAQLMVVVMGAAIVTRHCENIGRLLAGRERRLGDKGEPLG